MQENARHADETSANEDLERSPLGQSDAMNDLVHQSAVLYAAHRRASGARPPAPALPIQVTLLVLVLDANLDSYIGRSARARQTTDSSPASCGLELVYARTVQLRVGTGKRRGSR